MEENQLSFPFFAIDGIASVSYTHLYLRKIAILGLSLESVGRHLMQKHLVSI